MDNDIQIESNSETEVNRNEQEVNVVYDYYTLKQDVEQHGSEGRIRDFKLIVILLIIFGATVLFFIGSLIVSWYVIHKEWSLISCVVVYLLFSAIAVIDILLLVKNSNSDVYEKIRTDNALARKDDIEKEYLKYASDRDISEAEIDYLIKKVEGELKDLEEKAKRGIAFLFLVTFVVSSVALVKDLATAYCWKNIYTDISSNIEKKEKDDNELENKEEVNEELESLRETKKKYEDEYTKSLVVATGTMISFTALIIIVCAIGIKNSISDIKDFNNRRNLEYLLVVLMKEKTKKQNKSKEQVNKSIEKDYENFK